MNELDPITDALAAAQKRGLLPTGLATRELRELGAGVLGRSVFTARATNVVFVGEIKKLIDKLAAGELSEGQVLTGLWEVLDGLGYDVERGGFPGEELEPGVAGTLQDLMSYRRLDLIVRTQRDLMYGAGQKMRGNEAGMLSEYPAWELERQMDAAEAREWPSRWEIAGGAARVAGRDAGAWRRVGEPTGMIALKGDPVWKALGAWENFDDGLGVDHPPFYFNSGMGWRQVARAECEELGVRATTGETMDEFIAGQAAKLAADAGRAELPLPQVSLRGVDTALSERLRKSLLGEESTREELLRYKEQLAEELERDFEAEVKAAAEAYAKGARMR